MKRPARARRPHAGVCAGLGFLLTLVAFPTGAAPSEASLDHSGSVGVVAALGLEYAILQRGDCPACFSNEVVTGFSPAVEVGGTLALGSTGKELSLRLRLLRFSAASGESLLLGLRRYSGSGEIKSFLAVDLHTHFRPALILGARAGAGAMVEASPVLGVFGEVGVSLGVGQGRRFGIDFMVGLQGRSYLLE